MRDFSRIEDAFDYFINQRSCNQDGNYPPRTQEYYKNEIQSKRLYKEMLKLVPEKNIKEFEKCYREYDDSETAVLAEVEYMAYKQGFKEAVQLLMYCMS